MKHLPKTLLLAAVILALAVTGCTRSASTTQAPAEKEAPPVKQLPTGTVPFVVMTEPASMAEILKGTQTAMALKAKGTPTLPVPPLPNVTFEAPMSGMTFTPAPILPSPTPGRPVTWALQKGEHPYCIARRHNVSIGELLAMNGLGNYSNTLPVGYVLKIPQTGLWSTQQNGPRALKPHPTSYTTKAGDTLYGVACMFGDVDPMAIAAANGIEMPYTLTAGKKLNIP